MLQESGLARKILRLLANIYAAASHSYNTSRAERATGGSILLRVFSVIEVNSIQKANKKITFNVEISMGDT